MSRRQNISVHVELGEFDIVVDVIAPGAYNPDQLDDMTVRAERLLAAAAQRHAELAFAEDDEPLDDEYEHDGKAPAGDLVTGVPDST